MNVIRDVTSILPGTLIVCRASTFRKLTFRITSWHVDAFIRTNACTYISSANYVDFNDSRMKFLIIRRVDARAMLDGYMCAYETDVGRLYVDSDTESWKAFVSV